MRIVINAGLERGQRRLNENIERWACWGGWWMARMGRHRSSTRTLHYCSGESFDQHRIFLIISYLDSLSASPSQAKENARRQPNTSARLFALTALSLVSLQCGVSSDEMGGLAFLTAVPVFSEGIGSSRRKGFSVSENFFFAAQKSARPLDRALKNRVFSFDQETVGNSNPGAYSPVSI